MRAGALVIVGCGWIARRHAAAAGRLGVPLIFASRDAARARTYARTYGGVAAYSSYEEALRDGRAEGAVICTPHDRHLADVHLALGAGRHVLVEKPIARTLGEADRMIDAAAGAGRVLMVAEQFHFMPAFRRVKALLEGDRIGELREIHLMARGYRARTSWRLDAEVAGGGVLIDSGIHYVHLLRWWGGGVRRLFAVRPPPTLVGMQGEDGVGLVAELGSGAVGLLSNSLGTPGIPRFQWSTVTGAQATCYVDNRGRVVLVRGRGGPRFWLFRRDTRGYEAMLTTFRRAMATGEAPEMDGTAGRDDLAVVLAAYRSLAEGRAVEVGQC